jgi:hypothetical protein
MDICLESFDYRAVNEGLADVGKKTFSIDRVSKDENKGIV